MSHMTGVEKGEVVQLHPEKVGNKMFAGCFMVIDELKSFGAQGYIQCTGSNERPGGPAYYRANWEEMVKLENGKAPFIIE